jgi:hypothetical protein
VTEKLKKIKFLLKILRRFSILPARFGATHLRSRENEMPKRPAFGQQMKRRLFPEKSAIMPPVNHYTVFSKAL